MPRLRIASISLIAAAAVATAQGRAECPPDVPGWLGNSSIPCQINLVGSSGGVADPAGEFAVVVRDLANNPIADCAVVIDFTQCTPDIRVCGVQHFPGLSVDCLGGVGRVSAATDANGIARFVIEGGANNAGGQPGAGFRCARLYAGSVLLGHANVGAFDENGSGGVNPADLSAWLSDLFAVGTSLGYVGRSDYDCTETISPVDLSLLLNVSFRARSRVSCPASYCE